MKDAPDDDPKENDTEEVHDILPEEDIDSLMVITDTPLITKKKWLRETIFRSKGTVKGQVCIVVIDGGNSQNIISQALVDRLQLKVRKHQRSYFARWLMTGDEVQVQYACSVTFFIGEDYIDTVWCNVIPMDSCDILLGRPWMYDKNGTNGMRDNT